MNERYQAQDIEELVLRAVDGDQSAWHTIVRTFEPLVMGVCGRYRLSEADAQEVAQLVWLRLFQNLPAVRVPAALPGWLVTTTQRQAAQLASSLGRRRTRVQCVESVESAIEARDLAVDQDVADELLKAERVQVVRDALDELTPQQRDLLLLVVADPPVAYAEISRRLNIPVGSIGPTRARHLRKLRQTRALREYSEALAG